jgi:hypothetical protein
MTPRHTLVAAALIAVGVLLGGCTQPYGGANAPQSGVKAAQAVQANGTFSTRVVLTLGTAERLGIQTALVREMMAAVAGESVATAHKVIPMAAVFYDKTGATWTYTNPEPLSYVRQLVSIARIDGDLAVLQSGPAVGTAVVTLGSAELAGIEDGVAGE